MPQPDHMSFPDAATYLKVTTSWLREALARLHISPVVNDQRIVLNRSDVDALADSHMYWEYKDHEREEQHFRSRPAPYVPAGLHDYHQFHAALNDFTWLLKAAYTPREALSRRRTMRLDHIFQRYLATVCESGEARHILIGHRKLDEMAEQRCLESLRKVWYNELAFATPRLDWSLMLGSGGVNRNIERSAERMSFPSWRIIQCYYVMYHSTRAIAEACGRSYKAEEHNAPLRVFKSECLRPAMRTILRFPFDLAVDQAESPFSISSVKSRCPHLRYRYAAHPRPPHRSFEETAHALHAAMASTKRAMWNARRAGAPYMIQDLLYHFRVWGNYVDINNMIMLKSQGFRAYLDQDLHVLTFFASAHAELAALACLGVDKVWLTAEDFVASFVKGDEQLWPNSDIHPLNVRFQIYAHMGRLDRLKWSPPTPERKMQIDLL